MYYLFKNKKVDKFNDDDIIKINKINDDEIIKVDEIKEAGDNIKETDIKETDIKETDEADETDIKEADEAETGDIKETDDTVIMPSLPIRVRKPIRKHQPKSFSLSVFSYKIIDASADNTLSLGIGIGLGVGISIGVCLGALIAISLTSSTK